MMALWADTDYKDIWPSGQNIDHLPTVVILSCYPVTIRYRSTVNILNILSPDCRFIALLSTTWPLPRQVGSVFFPVYNKFPEKLVLSHISKSPPRPLSVNSCLFVNSSHHSCSQLSSSNQQCIFLASQFKTKNIYQTIPFSKVELGRSWELMRVRRKGRDRCKRHSACCVF